MNTIFSKDVIEGFIARINLLDESQNPVWGQMSVSQMVRHCVMNDEMLQGKKQYERLFMGRLFGPIILKKILKDESDMGRNKPTHPILKIRGEANFEKEKQKWIQLLKAYEKFYVEGFIHPFFGKMTHEEIGRFAYKHTDHHLRQFNV